MKFVFDLRSDESAPY